MNAWPVFPGIDLSFAVLVLCFQAGANVPTLPAPQPARDVPGAEQTTAILRGRVTAADSGRPLRRAEIVLRPASSGDFRIATANGDGAYEIRDVPPGRYTIQVKRNGYLPTEFGQRSVGDIARIVIVAARSITERLDVALMRMSVISGRVTDELGEPIAGVTVFAMRPTPQLGRPQLAHGGAMAAHTDDAGRYRVLGLAAGEYVLMTLTDETWRADDDPQEELSYAPSYYPGTNVLAEAQRIQVGAAREVAGIDLSLVPRRTAAIRGVAVDARGAPLVDQPVSLMRTLYRGRGAYVIAGAVNRTKTDGTWSFDHVRPGEYRLFVKTDAGGRRRDQGDRPILVDGVDVEGIVVIAGPGGTIRGRISVDGGTTLPRTLSGLAVRARSVGPDPPRLASLAGPENGRVASDGTFEYSGTFGLTQLSLEPQSSSWTLRAVMRGDHDISGIPLDLSHGEVADGIHILLTTKPSGIRGELRDADDTAIDGTVVVFPDDPTRWTEGSPLVRVARTDSEGRFEIDGLPPGAYRCVGLSYLEADAWTDAGALQALSPRAQRVPVAEGEIVRVVLAVRP